MRQQIRVELPHIAYACARASSPVSSLVTSLSLVLVSLAAATMSGCGSAPVRDSPRVEQPQISRAPISVPRSRGGGYYLDDGPGDSPPPNLDTIPEPVPQFEPLHRAAMRPYAVMGQTYTPMTELSPYKARGVASWYGRRYHGKQTSIGEIYDMYGMTAAHPLLPLPSYVRVTHLASGKSVVVRVNDRGPFIDSRLIDLSYTAAYRLGVVAGGSAVVEVEAIIPDGAAPSTAVAVRSTSELAGPGLMASKRDAVADATNARSVEVDAISDIAAAARDNNLSVNGAPSSQPALPLLSKTVPATASGVYLQLAAFGSRNNAESYLARAKLQVEWIAELLHLFARDGLYRIHAGPYASSHEARQAAERIALTLGAKPLVVTR